MSVTAPLPFRYVVEIHSDGERRGYLVDKVGLEDDYSALFVTATIRKEQQSMAVVEAALRAINVLAGFCRDCSIDLGERFRKSRYLTHGELLQLSDYAAAKFDQKAKRHAKVVSLGKVRKGYAYVAPTVKRATYAARLTYIVKFLDWLARYLLKHISEEHERGIRRMTDKLMGYRGSFSASRDDLDEQEFSEEDNTLLNEFVTPGSDMNPFTELVQMRNLLLVELHRQTGVRPAEALGIRIREDVDQVKRTIKVRRRHDSKEDRRPNGDSNAKTLAREIPISDDLMTLISQYLVIRRSVPGASAHRFLFVTHKSGPSQGKPMTKAGLREAFKTIANADDGLSHLSPKELRHLFSAVLARVQQADGDDANKRESHRRVRNFVAGRKPASDVDSTYIQLETKRQAKEAMLAVHARLSPGLPTFGRRK